MIRLVRAEIIRLVSRRFTMLALIAALLGVAAFQLQVNESYAPPSAAQLLSDQQAFDQVHSDWDDNIRSCQSSGRALEDCAQENPEPLHSDFVPLREFDETALLSVQLTTYLVALVAFLVASSFIGAEYGSGAIGNWLTFVPRRGPVFWSKLATISLAAGVAAAAYLAMTLLAAVVIARVHDLPTAGLHAVVAMAGRGIVPAFALAIIGFCVGLVTRHTAAAIGVLSGYLFVSFVRVALLGQQTWASAATRWTPEGNLAAIVERGHRYQVFTRVVSSGATDYESVERTITLTHGLLYWVVLLVAVIALSRLVFARRDVA